MCSSFSLFSLSQYQDQTGIDSVKCKTCKNNTYQADDKTEWVNHDNETDCLSCPRDLEDNLIMFAAQSESKTVQGCSACPAGKQAGSTECVNCVAGRVSSSTTDLKCEKCDVGKYQNEPGLPSCIKCVPGQYQDAQHGISCQKCKIGQHDAGNVSARDTPATCENCKYQMFISCFSINTSHKFLTRTPLLPPLPITQAPLDCTRKMKVQHFVFHACLVIIKMSLVNGTAKFV